MPHGRLHEHRKLVRVIAPAKTAARSIQSFLAPVDKNRISLGAIRGGGGASGCVWKSARVRHDRWANHRRPRLVFDVLAVVTTADEVHAFKSRVAKVPDTNLSATFAAETLAFAAFETALKCRRDRSDTVRRVFTLTYSAPDWL